jgi:SAM-dependent methyltransferase
MSALSTTAMSRPGPPAPADWPEIYDRLVDLEEPFTGAQVEALGLKPHQRVLDLGAGSGRLSIPIARRVASVTALDRSSELLSRLDAKAAEAGLDQIHAVEADWDVLEPGRDIERHDVVVAARFNGTRDLMKLDAAANERVCLLMFSGPSTKALHSALLAGIVPFAAEPQVARHGFSDVFNELCDLGLDPNVLHLADGFTRVYGSVDAAVEDFSWLLPDPSFSFNLRRNLTRFLVPEGAGVRFLFRTRSTLVWWEK